MNHTLIPHPQFSLVSPVVTAREIALRALCASLKDQVINQAVKITALEERNRALTKALHRQAACGGVLPEVLYFITLSAACLLARHWLGLGGAVCIGVGLLFGAACVLLAGRDKARTTTPRRRAFPAHFEEPPDDARCIDAIRLGEAYAEESEFEPFERGQIDRAVNHPDARAARARFEATAAALR
ncbi:MAG: hypothetical protein HS117_19360 [Verrucomicrobiaceae bacterium]|nr:hypothetical protein [Verrucomicrobiaceae bacterium]